MSKNRTQSSRRGETQESAGEAAGDVFDIKRISRLVELMKEHDLGEIDLAQGDQKIRLRRGVEVAAPAAGPPLAAMSGPKTPSLPAPAAESSPNLTAIKSEMVGTFYTAASPDAPPFVKVGDHVGPDTIVCIIEAMKVFNEIPAGISGKIVACMVQNGDPVGFEAELFKVDTSQ